MEIPLDFRIRVSSIELNEIDGGLIELMKSFPDKICRHLHIPLQSGSEEILKLMNRRYSVEDFKRKTDEILSFMPDLALTSDVISGFPGETHRHHAQTAEFIQRTKFARLHIFRYSDRQGTRASNFSEKVNPAEIKKRAEELFEIDASKRKSFVKENTGKTRKAVRIGKNKALTDNYITVQADTKTKNGIFETVIDEFAVV
jgi:threonylcarbamoyladenosine tRNA methylthiotransferase MtaB